MISVGNISPLIANRNAAPPDACRRRFMFITAADTLVRVFSEGGVVIGLSFLFGFNLSVLQANDALLGAVLQFHDNAHAVWLVRLEIVH